MKPHPVTASVPCKVFMLAWLVGSGPTVPSAHGALHYQCLASFGIPDTGVYPNVPLIQGIDGFLYGGTIGVRGDGMGGFSAPATLFRLNSDGSDPQVLQLLSIAGPLLEGRDGMLYGTTSDGGANGGGTVFRINKDGSAYSELHSFPENENDGEEPSNGLVQGSDGFLYGTTSSGGTNSGGTVFRLDRNGSNYTLLHCFPSQSGDARNPYGLLQGKDGPLYGVSDGVVFRLNPDGSGYAVVYNFSTNPANIGYVNGIIETTNGTLCGTSYSTNGGTAFKLNTDGSGYTALHEFSAGILPNGLIEGVDGALYGTTAYGGTNGSGIVYKLSLDGSSYSVLHQFPQTDEDGSLPIGLVQGRDGALYGTTFYGGIYSYPSSFGTVFKLNPDGSGYTVIHSFRYVNDDDGAQPNGRLVQTPDGVLYGTTSSGGTNGAGTVFRVNIDGSGRRALYHFPEDSGDAGGLVQGSDAKFYGTTSGGTGTVFALNGDGYGYNVLHRFSGSDGGSPLPGLVEGSDGALYGTTYTGGSQGAGSVFRLSKNGGGFQVIHSFATNGIDGQNPVAGLVEGSDGALYGATGFGNTNFLGTVFKLNKDGSNYQVLHVFSTTDGANCNAPLVQGRDGALYGTTYNWGTAHGGGIVFRINMDGSSYRVLHEFDAFDPWRALVEGRDGFLYGTTSTASTGYGIIFRINKDGTGFGMVHQFNGNDGSVPAAGLIQGIDGSFFGTTWSGGSYGRGAVFRFWPPETPDLLALTISGSIASLSFSGVSGGHYQVLRSTDLSHWTALPSITMPSSGIYTNADTVGPSGVAYYRAAWLP
jgi:uncharacterized repeat protein (TIGR03803 family)